MLDTKTFELLSHLKSLNVKIQADGDKLRISAPDGVLTPELREELAACKTELLTFLKGNRSAAPLPPIVPDKENIYEPFPLTDVQQAYWIGRTADFDLGNVATHIYSEYENSNLDVEKLEKAWQRVIDRHDMLRAVIRPDGRQQILREVPSYKIMTTDLRGKDSEYVDTYLESVRERLSHQVLPSDKWPLFEICVSYLDDSIVRLHVSIDLLIADARSCQLLIWEFSQFYNDPGLELPPLEISFRDCMVADEDLRKSDFFQRSLDYWKKRLPALPMAPELPLAVSPSQLKNPRFVRRMGRIEADVWGRLKTLGARAGITPSVVLLTAFSQVLSMWSKSPKFTLNLTLFNRMPRHPQINDLIGDFTSLTLLEIDNSGGGSYEEHARRIQERMWEDLDNRHVSGVRVMRELAQMQGGLQGVSMPIVFTSELDNIEQKIFVASQNNENEIELVGLGKEIYGISQTPQVWLDHQVGEQGGVLNYNWDTAEDLFPEGMIDMMFDSYYSLLHVLAEGENEWQKTAAGLVSRPDSQNVLAASRGNEKPVPGCLLNTLFNERVSLQPSQIAVISGEERLTYEDIYRRSNQVGWWLREHGATANSLVAIVMEKGWEQVVGALGVLQSGAAYLPISSDTPQERLDYLLEHSKASLVLTQSRIDSKFNWPSGVKRLTVDGKEAASMPDGQLEPIQKQSDLAYVIYTSGSTGEPKGVMIDHLGAVNTILDINSRFGVNSQDRVLAVSALSFDLSVYDIFGTLAAGGAIVIPNEERRLDPSYWASLISEEQVTIWNTVPALMEILVEYMESNSKCLPDSMRLVLMSGDWIPVSLPDQIRSMGNKVEVVSLGGATEASIWSIIYPIGRVDPSWNSIPYGKAMTNQNMYVLDDMMMPRSVWVPGNIYIGGIGVAKGYWRDDEKTNSSFVVHPSTGERLYYTGDLGRYLPDGNIEFLGREDFQVKVGGHRIELGEIENALNQHPSVHNSVVLAVGEHHKNKKLVAYFVPAQPTKISTDELRSFLAGKLPNYMVPVSFIEIEALPLSPNGKVNRQALPAPDKAAIETKKEYAEPQTQVQKELAIILAEELGLEKVGIHDNFFELGGDSILAIRFLLKVRQKLDVDVPVRRLFEKATIEGLAEEIEKCSKMQVKAEKIEDELPQIQPNPKDMHKPFPLTGLQQAYLVGRSDAVAMGNIACHTYEEVDIQKFDLERFGNAWRKLIDRHDVLRTVILPDGNQEILDNLPVYKIEVLDLRGREEEYINERLADIRERMSHQVMNIHKWPLFEIKATLIDDVCTRLHLSVDAMIADAWSVGILTSEVCELYLNPGMDLEPLEITFRDYVMAEHSLKETEVYKRSLEYWQSRMPTLPPAPDLPLAKNIETILQPQFVRRRSEFDAETWRKLKANAAQAGITPAGVMLAAFSEVLAIWSKSPNFTINVPQFNRLPLHRQVDDLVGEFASFYLLEVNNSGENNFSERARRVQDQLWQDMNHSHVSGVQLVRELTKAQGGLPNVSMPIVYTSTIGLINQEESSPLEDLGKVVFSISQTPQVWLDCQVGEKGDGLLFNWDAVDELFPEGLLDDMFDAYCKLLNLLSESEEAWNLRTIQLLPKKQLERRMQVNSTDKPTPDILLNSMFEEQAEKRPDKIAVISGNNVLTYRDLYQKSNQLGRWLREKGAKPNTLVGIVMEKGWEQIVAMMGILQSGAACLPIDSELPRERLWYLLDNSEVEIVLTQSSLDESLEWPENIMRLPLDTSDLEGMDKSPLSHVQSPDDLAYVIYTSGSTGMPKGVMITHKNVVNVVVHTNSEFGVSQEDRAIHLTALHHDLSMYDIFGMLSAGGTLVIPDAALRRDPAHWAELIKREGVTIWNTVPAMMEMLVTYVAGRSELLSDTLRLVILGGDWVPVTLPSRLKALVEGVKILSIGGPTETTIWNIWYHADEIKENLRSIPYGKPIANSRYYILDERMEERPDWVPGEMYCSGIQLAKGYWRDEEKTRAKFITHPETGERLYRTGDMGRFLPDGNIEFVGRADFQVKINGLRIELGEIEAALTQHPGIRAAVASVVGENTHKRIIAYVVPEESSEKNEAHDPLSSNDLSSEGIITDPIERLEFKQKHLGIRRLDGNPGIQFDLPGLDDEFLVPYFDRRSYRNFEMGLIPKNDFGRFLSCLVRVELDKLPFPKYRYASAGGLYPVQIYIYIKPDRIEGVAGGAYYFNPYEHRLVLINEIDRIEPDIFPPGNREIFEGGAFTIFLVGQMEAIKPMYGSLTMNFCFLEAGLITQMLEFSAPLNGLGLCQIGNMEFDRLRKAFDLNENQVYLHCILGGKIDTEADKYEALVKDWGGYRISLDKEPGLPLTEQLKEYLTERIPSYMVPSEYIVLGELPLTPNGKINRQALPVPDDNSECARKVFVEPKNPIEKKLAGMLARVLNLDKVSTNDSFFELGADSLMAIQLISQVRQVFQIELPLRQLFTSPTVSGLAKEIAQLGGKLSETENGDIDENQLPVMVKDIDNRYEPFPLTDVQQAYWVGRNSFMELGNIATHVYLEMEQAGMDVARFEWAWQQVIKRHEMLRAVIRADGQQQILKEVPDYHIEVLDLSGFDKDTVEAELKVIRDRMSHQVLPADKWPLFEIRATRMDNDRLRLHVSLDLLISDVWSARIVTREITHLYQSDEPLSPIELSFRDYVIAETSLRDTDLYKKSLEYWLKRIQDLPPAPELPLAKNPATLTKPHFIRRVDSLDQGRWEKLKARATQAGITQSGMLAAAYAEVLTAWCKSPHFTLNLTLFNRLPFHQQVNEIVGDFTSLILLEVDNSTQDSFITRARRLQDQIWEDLDHRYVSGVRVIRELARLEGGAPRASMPVVFTSTLNLGASEYPTGSLDSGDDVYGISQTPQVWLDHVVSEQNGALAYNWDAVEELFPEEMLDNMFEAYCRLLKRLADEDEAWNMSNQELIPVPRLQLENRKEVNAAEAPVSQELLHGLFGIQAKERPNQVAVTASGTAITYDDICKYSNRLGRWLRNTGAKPNSLVAVVMEKGWEQVAAVLGILKSGAAYLPISADLPSERINYLLDNGEVNLVLTQSWVNERMKWPEGIISISLDKTEQLYYMDSSDLDPVQKPEDLAYVIYTSGSTGQPKGVMIDHRGAVNTILDINRRFGIGEKDRVLALSALNFDLSVYDIFGTFAAGGTIVIPDATSGRDPGHWARLIKEEGITVWNSVPALMEMLTEYVNGSSEKLSDSLRLVMLSGDWIPLGLPDQIRELGQDIKVVSLGGATEASIWSIYYPIGNVDPEWKSIPYGKPLDNQKFHVLDGALEPRPDWVPGQLYIGGIGLAKGYWRDKEKTDASFIIHPKTGERLYRTGDLGRYMPDGNIEFLGREDSQVKIQGYRIELGEIEAALGQHPEIQSAVVTVSEEKQGGKNLVAYYVPAKQESENSGSDSLAASLPQFGSEDIIMDPVVRLKFKMKHMGIRQDVDARDSIELNPVSYDESSNCQYISRRSYRSFDKGKLSIDQLSNLLGCLAQVELDGVRLPKYRYGSAGSLYPVQTYLYVKPDRIEGLDEGIYYFNPEQNSLVLISDEFRIDSSLYPAGNKEIFEASAFSIYLVGQLNAVSPLYGDWSRDFCLLEAGLMSQLLETTAPEHQLGLCQIGSLEFDSIKQWFKLDDGHIYLHSLLGGRQDQSTSGLKGMQKEAGELGSLMKLVEMIPEEDETFSQIAAVTSSISTGYIKRSDKGLNRSLILDPVSRLKFKMKHPGIRALDEEFKTIRLSKNWHDKDTDKFILRRSYRKFEQEQISLEDLSCFMGCLKPVTLEEVPMPKYRYASAGSLYPVQAYLYVKAGRVKDLKEGIYYYNPQKHSLMLITEGARIDPGLYPPGNREVFEEAAFAIFLVGQMDAIAPLYGSWSPDFCMLEAGIITQLMEASAPDQNIGLCQVGSFEFDSIRKLFNLSDGHIYLHSILGGRISPEKKGLQALIRENSDTDSLIRLIEEQPDYEAADARSSGVLFIPGVQEGERSQELLNEDIKNFLRKKLPEYMVPSIYISLENMPLTANGKVDRRALPEPDVTTVRTKNEKEFAAPQTELENKIAAVWQEVLGVDTISINDSFFDLGGNSVHLVRVYNKLKETTGQDLPIVLLFEYPTIHSLCQYLSREQSQSSLEQSEERADARKASRAKRRQNR